MQLPDLVFDVSILILAQIFLKNINFTKILKMLRIKLLIHIFSLFTKKLPYVQLGNTGFNAGFYSYSSRVFMPDKDQESK